MKEKISSGMQTVSAIKLFRHQELKSQLDAIVTTDEKSQKIIGKEKQSLQSIKSLLTDALASKKLLTANDILGNALAFYTLEDLILEVIAPTTTEIGEKWAEGQISISVEHLVTNYLRQRLIMWMVSSPPALAMKPIILAYAPQEWNDGSLLILGTLLRRKRIPISYLGQSIPLSDLANFVEETNPALVVLVAMGEESALELSDLPQTMTDTGELDKPIIGFGGRIFVVKPKLRENVPAIYLGDTFEEDINSIEKLLIQSIR